MGTEYRIRSDPPIDRAHLDSALRSLPHFTALDSAATAYEYRHPANAGPMPDASVGLQDTGTLTFCDYGGAASAEVLGALTRRLLGLGAETVMVELLE